MSKVCIPRPSDEKENELDNLYSRKRASDRIAHMASQISRETARVIAKVEQEGGIGLQCRDDLKLLDSKTAAMQKAVTDFAEVFNLDSSISGAPAAAAPWAKGQ